MEAIVWEPLDGQCIVHVCNVISEESFNRMLVAKEVMDAIFQRNLAIVVIYNNPKLYLKQSKKLNNFIKSE